MIKILSIFAVVIMFTQLNGANTTVEKIIEQNIINRGGIDKFHTIQSVHITGRLVGPNLDGNIQVNLKRPNMYREELLLQDKTIVKAYNGKMGWTINPFIDGNPHELTGDELNNIQDQADINGPLVDYSIKGYTIELVGKEKVKDKDCYKLKITYKSGNIMYQYLDTSSLLEIREELIRKINGNLAVIEEDIGDYRSENGILCPHEYISNVVGSTDKYTLTFNKIEFNQGIENSKFEFPSITK